MVSWWHPDENSYVFKQVKHNTSFSGIEEPFGRVEGGLLEWAWTLKVALGACFIRPISFLRHARGEEESIPFGHR